jgi:hypothetical protein
VRRIANDVRCGESLLAPSALREIRRLLFAAAKFSLSVEGSGATRDPPGPSGGGAALLGALYPVHAWLNCRRSDCPYHRKPVYLGQVSPSRASPSPAAHISRSVRRAQRRSTPIGAGSRTVPRDGRRGPSKKRHSTWAALPQWPAGTCRGSEASTSGKGIGESALAGRRAG